MRYVWLVFVGLLAALALVLPRLNRPAALPAAAGQIPAVAAVLTTPGQAAALLRGPAARADSVVAFGLAQRGAPYRYAGTSPLSGFDCSGFILYTFARFGVAVPHSTALLIDVGVPVPRAEARPGDIVVFTGTAPTSAEPGHAGIVVSAAGQLPLRFVHASSARRESGVKVSQVEGTGYERRFMQVRRVLGVGASSPAPRAVTVLAVAPRVAASMAALPPRPVAVAPPAPAVPPAVLKTLPRKTLRKSGRVTSKKGVGAAPAANRHRPAARLRPGPVARKARAR